MESVLLGSQSKAACVTRARMTKEVRGCHYPCLSPSLFKKMPTGSYPSHSTKTKTKNTQKKMPTNFSIQLYFINLNIDKKYRLVPPRWIHFPTLLIQAPLPQGIFSWPLVLCTMLSFPSTCFTQLVTIHSPWWFYNYCHSPQRACESPMRAGNISVFAHHDIPNN